MLLIILLLCTALVSPCSDVPPYTNGLYFTNWGIYGRNYQPSDVPAKEITHLYYAFMNVRQDGTVYTEDTYADVEKHYPGDSWEEEGNNAYGCVKHLYALKRTHRHLKILLSIGGWTWSSNFAAVAASSAGRETFAKTSVKIMNDRGLDGIDVDWEYPADEVEAANMILLLEAVRQELDEHASINAPDYHFLLSIAAPAGLERINVLDLPALAKVLDHINLMAYDYAGSFSELVAHQANLYPSDADPKTTPFNTHQAVQKYVEGGVPADKIVLGMPLYGRSFAGTDGLGKAFEGAGQGTWELGVEDYKMLPREGAVERTDTGLGASYSYSESTRELVSYDNIDIVRNKVDYIHETGLRGAMFWEASGDHSDADKSLVKASFQALGDLGVMDTSSNWIDYPTSQYDNIARWT